ncbi:hypothetical protein PoB_005220500 [Plakobranchus ocellatus]|uniref:Uncharacterized protein n=1 Tax=Plakobranchus ocellatus TaxID=259542 RepID=A0AAV4C246_9GAST|nr:hypothetical protein PoB_005220500 [Plakobranchus ocellatus]
MKDLTHPAAKYFVFLPHGRRLRAFKGTSPQQGDLRLKNPRRPRSPWRGSNPRQKGPSRSQGGLTSHCTTDAPLFGMSLRRIGLKNPILKSEFKKKIDPPAKNKTKLRRDLTGVHPCLGLPCWIAYCTLVFTHPNSDWRTKPGGKENAVIYTARFSPILFWAY